MERRIFNNIMMYKINLIESREGGVTERSWEAIKHGYA